MKFKQILKQFEKVLFPGYSCDCCGIELKDNGVRLCDDCKNNLVLHDKNICIKCGASVRDGEIVCDECKNRKLYFDKAFSVCDYNEISAKLIKDLKFNDKRYIAETLGKMMANYLKEKNVSADVLTFVPLSNERQNARGFNQSKLIAEVIGNKLGIGVEEFLFKKFDTTKQSKLSREMREKNLDGAFAITEMKKLRGKTVIIVDDVFTTGTTLNKACEVLRKLNPDKIYAVTFAKTNLDLMTDYDA